MLIPASSRLNAKFAVIGVLPCNTRDSVSREKPRCAASSVILILLGSIKPSSKICPGCAGLRVTQ